MIEERKDSGARGDSIDVRAEIEHIWSIANTLRGAYAADKYRNVVIPMIIIRRMECALAGTKVKVVAAFEKNPKIAGKKLQNVAGFRFYNTSRFTLAELLNDSKNMAANFESYIDAFSANIQEIIRNLDFKKEIEKMDKNGRLFGVVKKFSELNLDPKTVDNHVMGYMFEDLIRRFSANAEAGDHYTPREVIQLMVKIILAEGCNDLLAEEKVATVLDMACGTGGMLSTANDALRRLNPNINARLFGQEINPESYAICLADMLIKGQDARDIHFQDTIKKDSFPGQSMRIVIANPPFGTPWGGKDAPEGVEKAVRDEYAAKDHGRWKGGLPATGDAQFLFVQHAVAKMDEGCGRAAIIQNGSPLFSGGTSSGESQIRRYLLEHDLVEAIIGLSTDLFYNTGIGIYIFVLSKNKRPERRGKVQLINAAHYWKPLAKSLGKKRREISVADMDAIIKLYTDFTETKECKIYDASEFLYREYSVYQPLQRNYALTKERIAKMLQEGVLDFLYNPALHEELKEKAAENAGARNVGEEKKLSALLDAKPLYDAILKMLEGAANEKIYKQKEAFLNVFTPLFDTLPAQYQNLKETKKKDLQEKIAFALSEMDKTAEIQKDDHGNVIYDSTTKDTELVKLTADVEAYFKKEVFPHVPDAQYVYEYGDDGKLPLSPAKQTSASLSREKTGAEFPFTRYFYEYEGCEKADVLLTRFMEMEKAIAEKVRGLGEGIKEGEVSPSLHYVEFRKSGRSPPETPEAGRANTVCLSPATATPSAGGQPPATLPGVNHGEEHIEVEENDA
ncbi:MAG: type I restriction-modification system subunit M [Tannerella sp.]|jgi:type I restriction enzyme M protein|nr:type I restriction-modification system subunit M [Tannerella sp.]